MEQLLRQIEQDPGQVDAYLVYADHLQTVGDPRGELIALQHAEQLDPDNEAVRAEVRRLLERHAERWLGPLRHARAGLTLTWRLGFIDGAVLVLPTVERLITGLRQVLELESARFMRRLSVEVERDTYDYQPVWEVLLAARRPATLEELRVGPPGRARVPAQLWEVFPRLKSRPEEAWGEIMARIDAQKRLRSGFEGAALPQLEVWEQVGPAVAIESRKLLVGLRAEIDKKREIGLLKALPRLFTPASLDALAHALLERWDQAGGPTASRWVLTVAGAIGGDRCARYLGHRLRTWSHQRAVQAAELLVQIGAPMGINEVYALSLEEVEGSRAGQAAQILQRMARSRGVDPDGVLDRAVPQILDAGTRERFIEIQRRWLEDLMINGHRLTAGDFRHHVASGPRRELAAGLVWGAFCGPELVASLVLADGPRFVDVEGEPLTLEREAMVGLLHPLELPRKERRRWREQLEASGVEQPFLQLRRPVFTLRPDEASRTTLYRYSTRVAGDYQRTLVWDGRWTIWESWDMKRDRSLWGCELSLRRAGQRLEAVAVHEEGEIQRVFNRAKRAFGDYDPVLVSELLYDLEAVTCRPVGGRFPLVERGEEGATCVVCDRAIAPGAVRVGVEREVRSEASCSVTTVWVHWGCAHASPELQLAASTRRDLGRELAEKRAALGDADVDNEPGPEEQPPAPRPAPAADVGLTEARVLGLCPDGKAVAASKKTADRGKWSGLGHDGARVWGLAAGTSTYHVWARLEDLRLRCDCPSRKRPCKHGVALLLLHLEGATDPCEPPPWVS